jgi:hypothetical protein
MKKIILVLAISLFGVSSAFSQWGLDISWDASECECTDGYFEIIYSIYDNANSVAVYTNEIISSVALTEHLLEVKVPLVKTHCDELDDEDHPSYTIHVTVNLKCNDGVITPVTVCSGTFYQSAVTCNDFMDINYPCNVIMIPVP